MKIYKLKTGNGVNDTLIHHTMERDAEFETLEDAIEAFEKEVAALEASYTPINDFPNPDAFKESDCVSTHLELWIDNEPGFDSEDQQIQDEAAIVDEFRSEIFELTV